MAGLAAQRRPVCSGLLHSFSELSPMRILMTSRTRPVFKPVLCRCGRNSFVRWLVTFVAHHRAVCSGQRKPGRIVPRQAEPGRTETLQGVTFLAPVVIGLARKLSFVYVRMAVPALRLFDLEKRVGPLGDVAFGASHRGVPPFQRVLRLRMLLDAEQRRLKSLNVVARGAFPTVGSLLELSAVKVRLVTIDASLVGHRLFEIRSPVTLSACYEEMLAQKRILGFGVVEFCSHAYLFPTAGGVAGLARGAECPPVRVGVTGRACFERQADILDVRFRLLDLAVALLASDLFVPSAERVPGVGMLETQVALPTRKRMATRAVSSQLAAMFVRVAGKAVARNAKESAAQIFHYDCPSLGCRDVFRFVTPATGQTRVTAFQHVTCLAVVELFHCGFPANQVEPFAVVIRMTTNAILIAAFFRHKRCMQAALLGNALPYLQVAVEALESRSSLPHVVTSGAVSRTTQRTVRLGQATR